jgi:hypothetical protein
MQRIFKVMPMLLLAASLPAFSAQRESPGPGATHRIQVFRTGKGEPRTREAQPARTAPSQASSQAREAGRTQPYQAAKPGEGAPKRP